MDNFIGEIRMAGFYYAPTGWALCDGSLLSIASNSALYSLLGTQFGGNGTTTFGLPDLRGRVSVHQGQSPGLAIYQVGQSAGSEAVTLMQQEMPQHTHLVDVSGVVGEGNNPSGAFIGQANNDMFAESAGAATMAPMAVSLAGSGQPHENMQPYQVVNFFIALQGNYPQRG
jgi:microcystin-dependent protein